MTGTAFFPSARDFSPQALEGVALDYGEARPLPAEATCRSRGSRARGSGCGRAPGRALWPRPLCPSPRCHAAGSRRDSALRGARAMTARFVSSTTSARTGACGSSASPARRAWCSPAPTTTGPSVSRAACVSRPTSADRVGTNAKGSTGSDFASTRCEARCGSTWSSSTSPAMPLTLPISSSARRPLVLLRRIASLSRRRRFDRDLRSRGQLETGHREFLRGLPSADGASRTQFLFAPRGSPQHRGGDLFGAGEPRVSARPQGSSTVALSRPADPWQTRAEYVALYPHVMLGIHYDHFWAVRVLPDGPGRCREIFDIYYVGTDATGPGHADLRATVRETWREVSRKTWMRSRACRKGAPRPDLQAVSSRLSWKEPRTASTAGSHARCCKETAPFTGAREGSAALLAVRSNAARQMTAMFACRPSGNCIQSNRQKVSPSTSSRWP